MAYLVVAYPELEQSDYEWIQSYRKQNDGRYFNVVEPHITLVFAVHDIDERIFIDEAKKQAQGIKPFDFHIKVATINLDNSGDYYHEFLVPDIGYSNIVKLHDKLYADKFADYLRLDIDFIPHIGIGNSDVAQQSKSRIDELNSKNISIKGKLKSIDVIEYKDDTVKTIEKIDL